MARVQDIRTDMQTVSVNIGGKVRHLKFDLNAFAELEIKYGNIQVAMEALQEGTMVAIRTILWAGLLHEEVVLDEHTGEPVKYNITPYQVGGWILPNQLADISEKITQAISFGLPEPETTELPGQVTIAEVPPVEGMATVVPTEEEKAEAKN